MSVFKDLGFKKRSSSGLLIVPDTNKFNGKTYEEVINELGNSSSQMVLSPDVDGTISISEFNNTIHDIFNDGSAIATYELNGDVTDLGGNYNGVAANLTYADGKIGQSGQSAVGNGVNSFINTNIQTTDNQDYSFSMWVNVSQKDKIGFFHIYTGTRANSLFVGIENNIWKLNINDNNVLMNVKSYNEWNHISVTYDADTYSSKFYINGSLIGSLSEKIPVSEIMLFDIRKTGSTFATPGQIDQVRIFNKVLTQEEVTSLYNEKPAVIINQESGQGNWIQYKAEATNIAGDLYINDMLQIVESVNGSVTTYTTQTTDTDQLTVSTDGTVDSVSINTWVAE